MKKIILASAVVVAALASQTASAVTTVICISVPQAHTANAIPPAVSGTNFMITQITPKCSANVDLHGMDGTGLGWYSVAGASKKGTTVYGQSTAGYQGTASCAVAGACTAGEVGAHLVTSNTGT